MAHCRRQIRSAIAWRTRRKRLRACGTHSLLVGGPVDGFGSARGAMQTLASAVSLARRARPRLAYIRHPPAAHLRKRASLWDASRVQGQGLIRYRPILGHWLNIRNIHSTEACLELCGRRRSPAHVRRNDGDDNHSVQRPGHTIPWVILSAALHSDPQALPIGTRPQAGSSADSSLLAPACRTLGAHLRSHIQKKTALAVGKSRARRRNRWNAARPSQSHGSVRRAGPGQHGTLQGHDGQTLTARRRAMPERLSRPGLRPRQASLFQRSLAPLRSRRPRPARGRPQRGLWPSDPRQTSGSHRTCRRA